MYPLILTAALSQAPLTGQVKALNQWEVMVREETGPRWRDRGAQLLAESGGNPNAQSWMADKNGNRVPCASGLMQFIPATWSMALKNGWAPPGSTPLEPRPAIKAGHALMLNLEGRFNGNYGAALGGYNAGPGSVSKAMKLADALGLQGQDAWLTTLERVTGTNKLTGKPHAYETRGYVKRIRLLTVELFRQRP